MRRLLLTGALLCAGCALLLGDAYAPLKKVPNGMGVAYVYEDDAGTGTRLYIDPDLSTPSAKHYVIFAPKGYYPYLMSEGRARFFVDDEANPFGCVEVAVASGSASWVRVSSRGESLRVDQVPADEANPALGEHRKLTRKAMASASGVKTPTDCSHPEPEPAKPEPAPKPAAPKEVPDVSDEIAEEPVEETEEVEEETEEPIDRSEPIDLFDG